MINLIDGGAGLIMSALLVSASVCLALIYASRSIPWLMRRDDLKTVQASHLRQVSRLGGIAIVAGFGVAVLLMQDIEMRRVAGYLLISVIPVFSAGLLEDLGYYISPRNRLLFAMVSSVLAIGLMAMWIRACGLPGLDYLFAYAPVGVLVTLLWTSGICHATNLIDGVNGLAGTFGTLASLGLAALAWKAGDSQMMFIALLLVPAILGFLMLNWPRGMIFLGDAGAYSMGHLLAWVGVVLAWRNAEISGAAVSLVFLWPIADTFFAIYRRRRSGKRFDHPDRMHIHQVVMRWLEIAGLGRARRSISNPMTTVVLLPFMSAPIIAAYWLADFPAAAFLAFCLFGVGFVFLYRLGAQYARSRRNPANVVRSVATVPCETPIDELADSSNAAWVLGSICVVQMRKNSYWTALMLSKEGSWRMLDKSFSCKKSAARAALRTRLRNRITSY